MTDGVHPGTGSLVQASSVAANLELRQAPNGVRYACFGDTKLVPAELERLVQAVPATVAPALSGRAFYFVPLALAPERAAHSVGPAAVGPAAVGPAGPSSIGLSPEAIIAPAYTAELADDAICHRNVALPATASTPAHEGVFISTRLLRDHFALAFEYCINVAHAFSSTAGIPEAFATLAWKQALADVRGETSQDAWEARADALPPKSGEAAIVDEKARGEYIESAFADALAIYMLSLAVDFDYAELREREYPLLAPAALAERLRLMASLFPPNDGYEFSIRYRRR